MTEDDGGCFKTGIGKLPLTDGKLYINTLLLEQDSVNVFVVKATAGSKSGNYTQEVTIVEGNPPTLSIR